jgi:hypothetical protein
VPDTTTTTPTPVQQLTEAGLTPDVVQKLQDTGNALTAQRKQRGKAVPEDLTPAENIKAFKTLASHAVSFLPCPAETVISSKREKGKKKARLNLVPIKRD